jgi:hypothetical protein
VGNIKDGAPLIVRGGDPLRLAVHDRMLALEHAVGSAAPRRIPLADPAWAHVDASVPDVPPNTLGERS